MLILQTVSEFLIAYLSLHIPVVSSYLRCASWKERRKCYHSDRWHELFFSWFLRHCGTQPQYSIRDTQRKWAGVGTAVVSVNMIYLKWLAGVCSVLFCMVKVKRAWSEDILHWEREILASSELRLSCVSKVLLTTSASWQGDIFKVFHAAK